jgi:hypothetical protein
LKREIRDILLDWLSSEQPVTVEEIRGIRRKCAYEGADATARVLMRVEKNVQDSVADPLRPLRVFFRRGPEEKITLELQMADNELFPDLRHRVCSRMAEKVEAEVELLSENRVRITLADEKDKSLFLSLYNWED